MKPMRDARLQRALESAPDAEMRPDGQTRASILAAARKAVRPAPREAWWKKLWPALGDRHMPWNAALATVAVATLVTVLWHDREVPGARLESTAADQAAPGPAPQVLVPPREPAPSVGSSSSSAAPAAGSVAPVPAPAPVPAAKPRAAEKAAVPERPRMEAGPSADVAEQSRRQPAEPRDALRDRQVQDLAKSAPVTASPAAPAPEFAAPAARSPAPALASAAAPAQATGQAMSTAPATATAPASAREPQTMARAARSGVASPSALGAEEWNEARVSAQGRSAVVPRAEAARLEELLNGLRSVPQAGEAFDAPVTARIDLMLAGERVATIELAGSQVRWTRGRAGQSATTVARLDAAQRQALQQEIQQLLRP